MTDSTGKQGQELRQRLNRLAAGLGITAYVHSASGKVRALVDGDDLLKLMEAVKAGAIAVEPGRPVYRTGRDNGMFVYGCGPTATPREKGEIRAGVMFSDARAALAVKGMNILACRDCPHGCETCTLDFETCRCVSNHADEAAEALIDDLLREA